MFDTIIRGGTIVDGRGGKPYVADIGIRDGRIAAIGSLTEPAHEVIEADGALVTPGFIDVHTHYDGQFLWDDRLDPSFSHGVTTAIGGNCGVGFAPAAPEHRQALIEMMEGVEDIPEAVLALGLDWNWRSFPDYMDRLAERHYAMDIAVQMTHAPLRVYVMGERAINHEDATASDIATMCAQVSEGMQAGAFGFSSARLVEHSSSKGAKVPGTFATDEELFALARALGKSGRGLFQFIPRGAVGDLLNSALTAEQRLAEHRRMEEIARISGRPLMYSLFQVATDPTDMPMMLAQSRRANAEGLNIHPMITARQIGMVHGLDSHHAFALKPAYQEIADLPRAERAAAMRDPARRHAILTQADDPAGYKGEASQIGFLGRVKANIANTFILANPLDYEPGPERMLKALAEAAGVTCEDWLYDHYAAGDGSNYNINFTTNYADGNLDHVHDELLEAMVVSGGGDGGAHMRMICDASLPTFQLAFWARDRHRGGRLAVEHIVAKLAGEPAALYDMHDRGTLEVGKRADINVIDHARLTLGNFHVANDLPGGGGRLLQDSTGYLATLVAGTITRRNDRDTGARPGRLLRSTELVRSAELA